MKLSDEEIKAPPALKARLAKLGLSRQSDLVLHLPLRYEDETRILPVAHAPAGCPVQVEVGVLDVSVQFRPRRQLVARVADASGELTLRSVVSAPLGVGFEIDTGELTPVGAWKTLHPLTATAT